MNLRQIASDLSLVPVTAEDQLEREATGCYAGDLLSCAMSHGKKGDLWLTVQSHANIVAVAVLLELSCIVVTEGAKLEASTIDRANAEGIALLTSEETTFTIAGKLWEMGIRNSE